jgi:hypothetical protein
MMVVMKYDEMWCKSEYGIIHIYTVIHIHNLRKKQSALIYTNWTDNISISSAARHEIKYISIEISVMSTSARQINKFVCIIYMYAVCICGK